VAQLAAALAVGATDQRFQARGHFNQGERFAQIVIGAEAQPFHPLAERIAGGEDQYRFVAAFVAPFAQNIQAIDAGQGQVQNCGVVGALYSAVLPSSRR
jgi:hypothetical protein